jgi:hypothetical protein
MVAPVAMSDIGRINDRLLCRTYLVVHLDADATLSNVTARFRVVLGIGCGT